MAKPMPPYFHAHRMLIEHGCDNIREWDIWAARNRTCPKCWAPPHEPCFNLSHVNAGQYPARNVWPHEERIDWVQLTTYLRNVLGYR